MDGCSRSSCCCYRSLLTGRPCSDLLLPLLLLLLLGCWECNRLFVIHTGQPATSMPPHDSRWGLQLCGH
jgi:hypothetical protein